MMWCMKLIKNYRYLCISLGVWLFHMQLLAQLPNQFEQYKQAYPSQPCIGLLDETEIEINIDKEGKPFYKIHEISDLLVMADNSSDFSQLKSYYNSTDKILKTNVYSLVPAEKNYKKIPVPSLKRTTEQDANNFFDDTYALMGHFPAISKGCILHEEYEYLSTEVDWGYRFFFGSSFPVEKVVFTVVYPASMKPIFRLAGADTTLVKFERTQDAKFIRCRWTCDKMKAYQHDALAPNYRYYTPHIVMQLGEYEYKGKHVAHMRNLADFHRWQYTKLKNTNRVIPQEIQQLADSITRNKTSREDKVKEIYRWVQNNIKYIAIEDGDNGFVPQEALTVIKRRYGDCKDKSSAITTLLRCIGEKAYLGTIGTKTLPYTFSKYPTIGTANHMIAIWMKNDSSIVPLDGTSRYLSIYEVPNFIQGKECFILIDENNFKVHRIPEQSPECNLLNDTLELEVNNQHLEGLATIGLSGNSKMDLMFKMDGKTSEQQKEIIVSELDFANSKMEVNNIQFEGKNHPDQDLKVKLAFKLPDYCVVSGNRLYVNLNLHQKLNNISIKPERTLPIESEQFFTQRVQTTLKIPKGYKLLELAPKTSYRNSKFGFEMYYSNDQEQITLYTEIRIGFHILEGKEMFDFNEMIQQLKRAYRQTVAFEKLN